MAVKKATTEKKEKIVKKTKTVKPKAPASPAGGEKVVKPAKESKAVKAKEEKIVPKAAKVVKETPVKAEKIEKVEKTAKNITQKYFSAIGRRKTSVAQVRLFENENAADGDLIINEKKLKEYFPVALQQNNILAPLKAVGMHGKFSMTVIVRGGGTTGQVEAVRLGVSRALVEFDEKLKKSLKGLGFMTRDSRKVERKKAGLKKARKSPQWSKR